MNRHSVQAKTRPLLDCNLIEPSLVAIAKDQTDATDTRIMLRQSATKIAIVRLQSDVYKLLPP